MYTFANTTRAFQPLRQNKAPYIFYKNLIVSTNF